MKRWGPVGLTMIGLALASLGWWQYDALSPADDGFSACRFQAVYGDLIHGTGDLGHCTASENQLYVSLALLATGALAFIAGWLFALSPRLEAKTPMPGWATASVLLIALVGVGYGGSVGWDHYQQAQDTKRLHHAERDLARLQLPANLLRSPRKLQCINAPGSRCGNSDLGLSELAAELAPLVHGNAPASPRCPPERRHLPALPCPVFIRGEIGGYPALVGTGPDLVSANPGKPTPPGVRIRVGKRLTNLYYVGSTWQIFLLTPDVR